MVAGGFLEFVALSGYRRPCWSSAACEAGSRSDASLRSVHSGEGAAQCSALSLPTILLWDVHRVWGDAIGHVAQQDTRRLETSESQRCTRWRWYGDETLLFFLSFLPPQLPVPELIAREAIDGLILCKIWDNVLKWCCMGLTLDVPPPFFFLRPLRCDPAGLPLLPSPGLPVGQRQGVWSLLLVALLVPVLLWPRQPAVRPRHQPLVRPVRLPGSPLLPVWLPHVQHLPPGHRVSGPRHGNFSDALPLTRSRNNLMQSTNRNFFSFYLLKSSGKRATLHKQDTSYQFAVNSQ